MIKNNLLIAILALVLFTGCGARLIDFDNDFLNCTVQGYLTLSHTLDKFPPVKFDRLDACRTVQSKVELNSVALTHGTREIFIVVPSSLPAQKHAFQYKWGSKTALIGSSRISVAVFDLK